MNTQKEWFETWFNSPYYHLLYKNRNDTEAAFFINNILSYLNPPPHATMLDLACGKGRHARFIATKGYHVTGLDLAPDSIRQAQQFAHAHLHFRVHDMRQVFQANTFDYVFNFFTSFGYFSNILENNRTLQAIFTNLKKDGYLLIDFLNAPKTIAQLVPAETKVINNVVFDIKRTTDQQFIYKHIHITDAANGYENTFMERVQALHKQDFEHLLKLNGFAIQQIWGDYALQNYDPAVSSRLIVLARK